jgi:hypothetical protein
VRKTVNKSTPPSRLTEKDLALQWRRDSAAIRGTQTRIEDCEWNPLRDEPATEQKSTNQRWGCARPAMWSVGRVENWHLCDECAKLPRFKRLRRRVRLNQ